MLNIAAFEFAVTAALTGLIWTVQLCVYGHFPRLLEGLGNAGFRAYHAAYVRSIGWVAGPLMVAELGLVLVRFGMGAPDWWAGLGLGLVAALWLHTFAWMVPLHRRLQEAPDAALARRVCVVNWSRTALWSVRLGLLIFAGA